MMEQEKSEKLLKYLHHIRTMVDYIEISKDLLSSGIITLNDHYNFVGLHACKGNACAMEQLIKVLNIRYIHKSFTKLNV